MDNPLLKIKLNWWEGYIISHLLGSQWQTKLWANITTAFDLYLSANAAPDLAAVKAWVNSHLDSLVAVLVHGNVFLATAIDGALAKVVDTLAAGLVAYVAALASPKA